MSDEVDDNGKPAGDSGDNGNNSDPKTLTQEDVDRAISKRVNSLKAKYEGQITDLNTQIEGLKKPVADDKGKDDGKPKPLTKEDIASLIADTVTKSQDGLRNELMRENLIAAKGEGLMPAYKKGITGANASEIMESIEAAQKEQADDLKTQGLGGKNFGSGNGNPETKQGKVFKKSEISDTKFYTENKAAIMAAARNGNIVDDL